VSFPYGRPIICIPCVADKGELIIKVALKKIG